jgi:hypothetical protein
MCAACWSKCLVVLMATFLAACATVSTEMNGQKKSKFYFGIFNLNIEKSSRADAIVFRGKILGVSAASGRVTAGWVSSAEVSVFDKNGCKAFFFVEDEKQKEHLQRYFAEIAADPSLICVVNQD